MTKAEDKEAIEFLDAFGDPDGFTKAIKRLDKRKFSTKKSLSEENMVLDLLMETATR